MADSVKVRNGLDTLIAENWSDNVQDTLFDAMPAMQVFFGRLGTKKGNIGLGIPDAGHLLTGIKNAKVRKREILSSLIYQPMVHNSLPPETDGEVMTLTSAMPTRSNWQNNSPTQRFTRPAVKWCELADPCKVPNEHLRMTKRAAAGERNGWEAIGDLLRVESMDVLGVHTRRWNQLLWGTYTGAIASNSGGPSNESLDKWDAIYSIGNALGNGQGQGATVYCGVDRSLPTGAYFRGNYINTATAANFRNMIRYANYQMAITNADGTTSYGLASKGATLDVMLCGGTLFNVALAEAESRQGNQVISAGTGIRDFGEFGFKRDTVRIDNTWIVFDPACPSGAVAGINPMTWTVGIHPDANFVQSTPTDQKNIEGGDDAHTWTLRSKLLLICEVPALNVYWSSVA